MDKINKTVSVEWKNTAFSIVIVIFLSLTIFFESWSSIVAIWYRSSTFTHGFLVIPISCWLVWIQRKYYLSLKPAIAWKLTLLLLVAGFLWLLADLINVQVVKQFATVCLLVCALIVVLGADVSKKMLFPLFFLFFMVPVGEELIPPLMELTATLTVWMIRLTGISIYREGLHFTLTSGNWSIAEACSGISYLIASITLGLVYAYLSYHSFWKRSIFVTLSIIVPLIANGLRAYIIVMIGHFSDKKLAVGADHLIYGGLFFGLVMMILLYIGSFWKDPMRSTVTGDLSEQLQNSIIATESRINIQKTGKLFLIIASCFIIWPFSSNWLSKQEQQDLLLENSAVFENNGWKMSTDPNWNWQADFKGVSTDSIHYFTNNEHVIAVYQASFGDESQGQGELVNSQNLLLSPADENWKIVDTGVTKISLSKEKQLKVNETVLRGRNKDLLALRWYHIGRHNTSNDYFAKWFQLYKRLMADSSAETIIVVLIEAPQNRHQSARKELIKFVDNWLQLEK